MSDTSTGRSKRVHLSGKKPCETKTSSNYFTNEVPKLLKLPHSRYKIDVIENISRGGAEEALFSAHFQGPHCAVPRASEWLNPALAMTSEKVHVYQFCVIFNLKLTEFSIISPLASCAK